VRLIEEIRSQLKDINIVSYSGGKDSSVVLQNVILALANSKKKLYIITSDTLMEIPYFQDYLNRAKGRINTFINLNGLNAELITVRPEIKNSFWVSVLGMGYPAAHMGFRWCTGKLKIDPISNFVRRITADKEFTVFVGVRRAESNLRARIYKVKNYKANHYAPILDWTSHDVWDYLMTEPCPWGDHSELINVYKYSSDECVYGEKAGVCVGNARYGCWACPLQKSTQLDMVGYHTNDTRRYEALKFFKDLLVATANNKAYRSRIRRNLSIGCGPFLVPVRQKLYYRLLETEAITGWDLITPNEISLIKKHWKTDAALHNIPDPTQPMLWGLDNPEVPAV
jgi:DNA sulfur modification protein DndC